LRGRRYVKEKHATTGSSSLSGKKRAKNGLSSASPKGVRKVLDGNTRHSGKEKAVCRLICRRESS